MRMPTLTCNRCGKEDRMMVDAPRLDDQRVYCIECYAQLFPPGWTDEYQPVTEPSEDDELDRGDPEYAPPACPICGADKEWVICHRCQGEGGFDSDELMQDDPLWYDGVEWEDCGDCNGEGGYHLCPNCEMK